MKERAVDGERTVVTHHQTTEVPEPSIGPFHDPSPFIPPQSSAILRRGPDAIPLVRTDQLHPALPRTYHHRHSRDALLLGLGMAILANSRPFEGLILCIPVLAALLVWACGRHKPAPRVTFLRVCAPLCAVILLCGVFIGYYNRRGTGSPFVFPYQVNEQQYVTTPTFFWVKPRPPMHYLNPQFEAFYNGWERDLWLANQMTNFSQTADRVLTLFQNLGSFFLSPELFLSVLVVPWILRGRKGRFLLAVASLCCLGFLLIPWFQPHYAAPVAAVIFLLVAQAFRYLRLWEPGGRRVGMALSRVMVAFAVLLAPVHGIEGFNTVNAVNRRLAMGIANRPNIEAQLNALPGKHLVLVHYSRLHNVNQEWVYNGADIDHAKIVWAREIPGMDLHPLYEYFSDRTIWSVDADAYPTGLARLK